MFELAAHKDETARAFYERFGFIATDPCMCFCSSGFAAGGGAILTEMKFKRGGGSSIRLFAVRSGRNHLTISSCWRWASEWMTHPSAGLRVEPPTARPADLGATDDDA